MFFKRKMETVLQTWKQDGARTAFCLVGARQTGKTTLIRHFARENYKQFIELNFLTNPLA